MNEAKLKELAKDLSREYSRSPRDMLGGYVILARCLDKCRSELVGIEGEYSYWPCALCSELEPFTGIDHDDLRDSPPGRRMTRSRHGPRKTPR
jgi:hypothetical protein